jgi:putative ABC transport system permease protein
MRWYQRLFRRARTEKRLDAELRFHLEEQIADYTAGGMPPDEARRRARLQFGGLDQVNEECRDVGAARIIETLIQDLRYGSRQLRRNPGFTAVAVITLALGIGATTAIFSVIDGVLLKPLPYPHPEQLIAVWLTAPGINIRDLNPSPSLYFMCRDQGRAFQSMGLYMPYSTNVTGLAEPEHVSGLEVTDGLLPTLGIPPILGRWFTRTDDSPGSADTVILTYGYWRRDFGGDRAVIGRTITVDGKLRQIIGVMPKRFHFDGPDLALILPLKLDRAKILLGEYSYYAVARLKPGVTLARADADLARLIPIELRSFPPPPGFSLKGLEDARIAPNLRSLKQDEIGNVGQVLWLLMGGISLVLVIACANVVNLLLVRIDGRRQELAIRHALGASRRRIAAELSAESLILAGLSGLTGLGLAYGALRVLLAMAPSGLPRLNEIGIDAGVVLFAIGISVVASLFFGCIPALKYSGAGLEAKLREGGRSATGGRERDRSRGVLVIAQVALALILLVSSGLMIRTFLALTQVNPGFVAPSQVQTFRVDIPDTQVKNPVRVIRMEQEIQQRIKSLPGVSSVGLSMSVPMDGNGWAGPVFAKDRTYAPGELPLHRHRFVAPGFFATLGTPLLVGRDFTWSDIYDEAPVAIVSEKLAREYWHTPADALGKQIRVTTKDDWREVIGVVGNVLDDGLDQKPPSSVYWPILAAHFEDNDIDVRRWVAFSVRSPLAGSESLISELRRTVWSVDANLPLADVRTLKSYEQASIERTSFTLVMLCLAGGMALLLGIIGIYGVIAYSVSQRTHEIGIRMALGARKRDVLALVLSQGIRLAFIGVAIGVAGALGLTRFLSSLLYGIKPTDPLTFIAVPLVLIAVAVLACYIPARRAARIDPMVALRHE